MVLSVTMKKWLRLKGIPNLRLECKSHTLFETKIAKIEDTQTRPKQWVALLTLKLKSCLTQGLSNVPK